MYVHTIHTDFFGPINTFFFKKTEGLNEYKCISVFEFSHTLIVEERASNV